MRCKKGFVSYYRQLSVDNKMTIQRLIPVLLGPRGIEGEPIKLALISRFFLFMFMKIFYNANDTGSQINLPVEFDYQFLYQH